MQCWYIFWVQARNLWPMIHYHNNNNEYRIYLDLSFASANMTRTAYLIN